MPMTKPSESPRASLPRTSKFSPAPALAVLGFVVSCPVLFAQAAQPFEAKGASTGAASASPALSHDLSGVWMQYPDKRVDGVPIVTGIDQSARPPLTPWGQARFDAAIPFMGPRAVAGKENNPSLRCEPEAVPKSLILPNPFEIVQIPGRVFMFFEEFHLWRTIWLARWPIWAPCISSKAILKRPVGTSSVLWKLTSRPWGLPAP